MIIEFNYQPDFGKLWDDIEALPHYKELADLDGIGKQVDMAEFSKNFFRKKAAVADVSVDSNANVEDSSMVTYEVEAPKPLFRINSYYMLWKTMKKLYGEGFARQAVLGQFTKDFYINDFHKFHTNPYCFNFSCLDVVFNGLPFVTKIKSRRPRHLSSFVGQTIQFVTYASNNVAGAVGLADFLICMSYYVDATVTRKDIEQELQTFIYSVNQPFRGGHQSPFTNISLFDKHFLTKMCAEYTFPDGSKPDVDRVQYVQRIYMDVMNKTLEDTPCTFPVTTACFSVDENRNIIDTEFLREVSDANLKFGWINFYAGQTSTLSSCCRLRSEANHEYFNSFGAGGTKIGSMGVVTLNLPRIAERVISEVDGVERQRQSFMEEVSRLTRLAAYINEAKRYLINKRKENGHLPLYTLGFMDINKQYSTCGLNGINEAVEILGYDILDQSGQELVSELLKTVNDTNRVMEVKFSVPMNCEQTPSENSAIKLAQADKIMGYNPNGYELYSNQFIPLTVKADVLDRIKLQGLFDSQMTGGAILHVNIGEQITDVKVMEDFIKSSVRAGVIYQAINYVLNVCEDDHVTVGGQTVCPICGKKVVEKLTRVVGFLTSVKNWHVVRREKDFPNREFYKGEKY